MNDCQKRYKESEKGKATSKNYYLQNKDKILIRCKQYRQSHSTQLSEYEKNRHIKHRQIMCNLKINGCAECGYNKCGRALDFHHTNPDDKRFNIIASNMRRNPDSIAEELNKCILLCANCHREITQLNIDNGGD